jgi:hypothetical protein
MISSPSSSSSKGADPKNPAIIAFIADLTLMQFLLDILEIKHGSRVATCSESMFDETSCRHRDENKSEDDAGLAPASIEIPSVASIA